jgi:hypothetical protein
MTRIRLRYRTLKLRAQCWVVRRLRAGQRPAMIVHGPARRPA